VPGILLVDDDAAFRAIVRHVLSRAGVPLTVVEDPRTTLEAARAARPDLILLDFMMPEVDGVTLFRRLQEDGELREIPAWMCSSRDDEDFVTSTYDLGIGDFVSKPISAKAFEGKVKAFLKRRAAPVPPPSSVRVLKKDVSLAEANIRSMLPPRPSVEGLDIGLLYRPHEAIGGDFYDFIPREGGLRVVIGDVSGHGISAAVIQTMARKVMQICLRGPVSVTEAIFDVNEELKREIPAKSFVAACVADWSGWGRPITIHRLGVPHPVRRGRGGAEIVMSGGTVLGVHNGTLLQRLVAPQEVVLGPGEALLLHTDGVIEAPMPDGDEFGFDRLKETAAACACDDAQSFVDACHARVLGATGARPDDDVTLLALRNPG
jgi:sigma-B regulation protein RsbU (phosphoserine phosphatase)